MLKKQARRGCGRHAVSCQKTSTFLQDRRQVQMSLYLFNNKKEKKKKKKGGGGGGTFQTSPPCLWRLII